MRLRELRIEKGMSIPSLSRFSNVAIRTIESIEHNNDCKVSTAIKLADGLKVSLDELCRDRNEVAE